MTAYFVKLPFSIEDLRRPHLVENEVEYEIVKTIVLNVIDYDNFITDMCVDRWFIENNIEQCRIDEDGVWHCILVVRKAGREGVLIMSDGYVFPKYAALIRRGG